MSLLLFAMGVGIISLLLIMQASLDEGFKKNIKGIDMVVGAKGSPLQLILSSVYHIDNPTGNIPQAEANKLKKHPLVEKGIPMAYGDNYKGYKILGTNQDYLELYGAELERGNLWAKKFEVVLGAVLAERLGMKIGDNFFSNHGLVGEVSAHEEHAFEVVGILKPSATVLDQLIFTGLESIWGVHESHTKEEEHEHEGGEEHEHEEGEEHEHKHDHEHETGEEEEEEREITAMLIKFRSPMGMMQLPRMVNTETSMQAALPAIEVNRLFDLFGVGIQLIRGIAIAIMLISGISIFISLYNNLSDRKYELALMRSMGASRPELFILILLEGLIIAIIGFFMGLILSRVGIWLLESLIQENYRYELNVLPTMSQEGILLLASIILGIVAALIPAWNAWRTDIAESLTA